ncbi:Hcp family type VI secretion system effector [Lysobacter cavernae]|uniref:Hcp family type VI secretion system effector n=1 Tax=Lysobacter cavernae TaxID=1685901 RepID=A0ABV7RS43_9GAMM
MATQIEIQRQKPSAFLSLDTIKGESRIERHKDKIEIRDYELSLTQPRSATASNSGGHTAARAEWSTIKFVKAIDIASGPLFQTSFNGSTLGKGEIVFTRADGDNKEIDYWVINLLNVVVSKVTTRVSDEGMLEEEVELSFGAIKQTYSAQNPGGGAGGKVVMQASPTLGKPTFAV